MAYSYVFEIAQHARGIDPRLSDFWGDVDHALSVVYFLTSQAYVLLFAILAVALFRPRARAVHPNAVLALRYGLASVFVGFAAGYRMLLHYQGRRIGAGDLTLVHAVGFHGLQVMLLVGWFIEDARLVHQAGLAWLAANLTLAAHVFSGHSITQLSPALVVFALALAVGAAVVLQRQSRGGLVIAVATGALLAVWPLLARTSTSPRPVAAIGAGDWVSIPGGLVAIGCAEGDACEPDETPRAVEVAPFELGRTEVSRARYAACVAAGVCAPLPTGGLCGLWVRNADQPATCVDWNDAATFCRWSGGRLPTATEWEYAARGGEPVVYPWGDAAPDDVRARYGGLFNGPAPVASYPAGASRWGLLHMADNVREWTATDYDATYKEVRGGAWNGGARQLRASNRAGQVASERSFGLGFRCARATAAAHP